MVNSEFEIPAFLIAGVQSGSGKTTVSLALMRALRNRGLRVAPFKCGPDYIDPAFHCRACGTDSINLDSRMTGREWIQTRFPEAIQDAQVAVVEGVMGLFDGVSPESISGSSAEIALLLNLPVVLVVNARGMAGSIAPLVSGFAHWRKDLNIIGVIANQAGSEHHTDLIRKSLEINDLPPLLGAFRRNPDWVLPERHLGLVAEAEAEKMESWFDLLGAAAEQQVNLDLLLDRSKRKFQRSPVKTIEKKSLRLAVAKDEAFHFYYPDNLHLLEEEGVELVFFSPLDDTCLPEKIDGVYLGGGFPEMFAERLSTNVSMRRSLLEYAEQDGMIYAECGGYMYLMRTLSDCDGKQYEMCGIIPSDAKMTPALKSLGYRTVSLKSDCIFGKTGDILKGHEFHYSEAAPTEMPLWDAFDSKGRNVVSGSGYRKGRICGSYVHLHWGATPSAIKYLTGAMKK